MTPEQRAVFINSQTLAANCKLQGMIAANQNRLSQGFGVAYTEDHFECLAEEFGLGHNQVVAFLSGD